MAKEKGLNRVEALYKNRQQRALELKESGQKVIGYLCAYPVIEMMTALDIVPFRIFGNISEPITKADSCLPGVVCPFIRSALDQGLKGNYSFLDGVVMAHACDVAEKTAHIWNIYNKPAYFHFIDTPHTADGAAVKQHHRLLKDLRLTLEKMAGKKMTDESLKKAVAIHNRQRALVRRLYDLKKTQPPQISGVETLKVMVALMSLPAAEGNELLEEVIAGASQRPAKSSANGIRLLLWGSIIDDAALLEMVEQPGVNVVMDDTCVGSRFFQPEVEVTKDPLEGLAKRYLEGIRCPRTFRQAEIKGRVKDYTADLEHRFSYLGEYAKEWQVDGVILQSLRYCDIHGYEVPQVKDYFKQIGLPSIYVEYDYSQAALMPLKTRVQAFLEIIGRG